LFGVGVGIAIGSADLVLHPMISGFGCRYKRHRRGIGCDAVDCAAMRRGMVAGPIFPTIVVA
jgi:hypothetical protein